MGITDEQLQTMLGRAIHALRPLLTELYERGEDISPYLGAVRELEHTPAADRHTQQVAGEEQKLRDIFGPREGDAKANRP